MLRIDLRDQAQRFAVGAGENVQAVVERRAFMLDTAGAAAGNFAGFKNGDTNVLGGQRNGGGHAGVTAADDGD